MKVEVRGCFLWFVYRLEKFLKGLGVVRRKLGTGLECEMVEPLVLMMLMRN
jgi:hypothetical protein